MSNIDFSDAVLDKVLATTGQCGVFVFGENYYAKMQYDNGNLTLANYHVFDQPGKNKYDNLAHELVTSRLIVKKFSAPVHVRTSRINTLWKLIVSMIFLIVHNMQEQE